MTQQEQLRHLCVAIEQKVGMKMHTPKDFEFLSKCVSEQAHENISASTLKRMWGYLDEGVTPRRSTLDVLSQFLGYREWDDFCEHLPPPDRGGLRAFGCRRKRIPVP